MAWEPSQVRLLGSAGQHLGTLSHLPPGLAGAGLLNIGGVVEQKLPGFQLSGLALKRAPSPLCQLDPPGPISQLTLPLPTGLVTQNGYGAGRSRVGKTLGRP